MKSLLFPNPRREVGSIAEISEYIGTDFPEIAGKTPAICAVIASGGGVFCGEVRYTDGSTFRACPINRDISGMYGGVLLSVQSISGTDVKLFRLENRLYATFFRHGLSCCYYSSNTEDETSALTAVLNIIISL